MTILTTLLLAAVQAGGLSWKSPASWPAEASSSAMRLATHRVPAAPGDSAPAELAIFFFGKEGGAVGANVERWFAQFKPEPASAEPTTRVETINGIRVTRVSAEGTFASGMPGQPTTPKATSSSSSSGRARRYARPRSSSMRCCARLRGSKPQPGAGRWREENTPAQALSFQHTWNRILTTL